MNLRRATESDFDALARLRAALWPESSTAEHLEELRHLAKHGWPLPTVVVLAVDDWGQTIGFAEVSIRPAAEGCLTRRVGYLEGWYVEPAARRNGIGRALVAWAEHWARDEGCTEFASDAHPDDGESLAAHRALGFEDAGIIQCFRKILPGIPRVTIEEYRDEWPRQFRAVAREIEAVFAGFVARVEHIGSTAVPGACAKPVLDVLLGTRSLSEVETRSEALAAIGYRYRPEHESQIPQRRYFVRAAGAHPRVHLHAVILDGPIWWEHLAFRDALRRDAELTSCYGALKRELATAHAHDKVAYTAAKAPFITEVLARLRRDRPGAA